MGFINDIYGSKAALKPSDLANGPAKVTIKGVELVEFDDGAKLKLSFDSTQKTFILNKTNAGRIAELYGQDYDNWPGKHITLQAETCDMRGERVPCVRVVLGANGAEEAAERIASEASPF